MLLINARLRPQQGPQQGPQQATRLNGERTLTVHRARLSFRSYSIFVEPS